MDPIMKKWAGFLISVGALIAFVGLYAYLMLTGWTTVKQPPGEILGVTAVLTGMVSGIVATMFGIKVPPGGGGGGGGGGGSSIRERLTAMGSYLTPFPDGPPKNWLVGFYRRGYFGMAVGAIVRLALGPNANLPEIVGGMLAVAVGTAAVISTNFMGNSTN